MPSNERRQLLFVAALAGGQSIKQAAGQAHVSETTGRRWLKVPLVRQQISELQAEKVGEVLVRLTALGWGATETLETLHKEAKSEMVRYLCARALLEIGAKMREMGELERRIATLEEAQGGLRRVV